MSEEIGGLYMYKHQRLSENLNTLGIQPLVFVFACLLLPSSPGRVVASMNMHHALFRIRQPMPSNSSRAQWEPSSV